MKEFNGGMPKSDQELLVKSLQNKIDKSSPEMSFVGGEATMLDAWRHRVSILEKYLNSLDISEDREVIMDLEYITRLMREQIYLEEELLSLQKVHTQKFQVQDDIEKGDEWKLQTGKNSTHEVKMISYGPKSEFEIDSIKSINKRQEEIENELISLWEEFEEKHPADYLIMETKRGELEEENRTN